MKTDARMGTSKQRIIFRDIVSSSIFFGLVLGISRLIEIPRITPTNHQKR
jgi:hypothetical protein